MFRTWKNTTKKAAAPTITTTSRVPRTTLLCTVPHSTAPPVPLTAAFAQSCRPTPLSATIPVMRWFALTAAALVASLALVACGGSDAPAPAAAADDPGPTEPAGEPTPAGEARDRQTDAEPMDDTSGGVEQATAAKPTVYWIHTEW